MVQLKNGIKPEIMRLKMRRKLIFYALLAFSLLNSPLFSAQSELQLSYSFEFAMPKDYNLYGARMVTCTEYYGIYTGFKISGGFGLPGDYYNQISPEEARNDYNHEYVGSKYNRYTFSIGGVLKVSDIFKPLNAIENVFSLNIWGGLEVLQIGESQGFRDPTYSLAGDGVYNTASIDTTQFGVEFGVNTVLFKVVSLYLTYSTATKAYTYGIGITFTHY